MNAIRSLRQSLRRSKRSQSSPMLPELETTAPTPSAKYQRALADESSFSSMVQLVRTSTKRKRIQPIYLDVGGRLYATYQQTLTKCDYFRNSLSGLPGSGTRNDPKFLDRDGEVFSFILQFLRQPDSLILPSDEVLRNRIWTEAEFFGLNDLKTHLIDSGYRADLNVFITWKHNSSDCGVGGIIPYGVLWRHAGADSSLMSEVNRALSRGHGMDNEHRVEFAFVTSPSPIGTILHIDYECSVENCLFCGSDIYPYDYHKETILFFMTFLQFGQFASYNFEMASDARERLRKLAAYYKCKTALKQLGAVTAPIAVGVGHHAHPVVPVVVETPGIHA